MARPRLLLLVLLSLAACEEDRRVPDTGARRDAGFITLTDTGVGPGIDAAIFDAGFRDVGFPDATFLDAAGDQDAEPLDAEPLDALPVDTGDTDAGDTDASGIDADTDAGATDALLADADPTDADPQMDAGATDAEPPSDAGVVVQQGDLIITEVLARSSPNLEWIEIVNRGSSTEITAHTLRINSAGGLGDLPIRSPSDPDGTSGTAVVIAPDQHLVGVPNPAGAGQIPPFADFVFGEPGALGPNALSDLGDLIRLHAPGGVVQDQLDFRVSQTVGGADVAIDAFPLPVDVSVQLDVLHTAAGGALSNDTAANWCAPVFRGSTRGAANHDCGWLVLSEVLYDFDSLSGGGDAGNVFVEIAGAAGAPIQDALLTRVEGGASSLGTVDGTVQITGSRLPLDGLYVIADQASAGVTNVPDSDQIEDFDPENGPDAIQLVREPPGGPPVLLDAFGYGTITPGVDSVRSFAIFEGTPVADPTTVVHPAVWARSDDEVDTDDNEADFAHDPTPTPGMRNGDIDFQILSVLPDDGLATSTAPVALVLSGSDFTDYMSVTVGAQTILHGPGEPCFFHDPNIMQCPVISPLVPGPVDITIDARAALGLSATRPSGFIWYLPNNETDTAEEADFCNLQFPDTETIAPGSTTQPFFGQLYEQGLTEAGGANAIAKLGYGPVGTDPTVSGLWVWVDAPFNVQVGNNDEYVASLTVDDAGTYAYTFRFSVDGGLTWSFGDLDGAGTNTGLTFEPANLGLLEVN